MKYLKLLTIIFFSAMLFTSCGNASPTNDAANTGKKKAMTAKQKSQNSGDKKLAKNASNETSNYWPSLKQDLKLSDKQITDLKNLRVDTRKQITAVRNRKEGNVKAKIKELKNKERLQMKTILGAKLFQEKIKWEKNWAK